MVDLSADWCGACKEFEAVTFHDPTVVAELQRLSLGKIDFTTTNPTNSELSARYQVAGLPCILFLNADGVEIANSRITGFLDPREFLGHLRSLGLTTP